MAPKRRYKATIEYDGTDFFGFQIQAKERTVQGEIEKTIKQVTQSTVRIYGAGRTDAGVHATGQVIAFNVGWRHSLSDLHRALNATLPPDIIMNDLTLTTPTFQPRFDALSRTYRYQIINGRWPSILLRRYAHHVEQPLNIDAMQAGSQLLIGTRNFASFGKAPQGNNTVRHLIKANWFSGEDNLVIFTITANAFLYRMVRKIVATLVQVGLGRLNVTDITEILEAQDLTRSAPPAPANGLCLVRVTYPEDVR